MEREHNIERLKAVIEYKKSMNLDFELYQYFLDREEKLTKENEVLKAEIKRCIALTIKADGEVRHKSVLEMQIRKLQDEVEELKDQLNNVPDYLPEIDVVLQKAIEQGHRTGFVSADITQLKKEYEKLVTPIFNKQEKKIKELEEKRKQHPVFHLCQKALNKEIKELEEKYSQGIMKNIELEKRIVEIIGTCGNLSDKG